MADGSAEQEVQGGAEISPLKNPEPEPAPEPEEKTQEPQIALKPDQTVKPVEVNKEKEDDAEPSALKEYLELFVRAGFWALLIYLFLFQVSLVEQDSMNPSFYEGDKLVIDKLTYRFSAIKRFDVIVFETIDTGSYPRKPKDYIKRVIGLPGETVEIHDGNVWIDGKKLDDKFGPTYVNSPEGQIYVVPPHHLFVMGDNRGYSKDSRSETGLMGRESLGFVPEGQIRGVVRLRFWPWNRLQWFWRGS